MNFLVYRYMNYFCSRTGFGAVFLCFFVREVGFSFNLRFFSPHHYDLECWKRHRLKGLRVRSLVCSAALCSLVHSLFALPRSFPLFARSTHSFTHSWEHLMAWCGCRFYGRSFKHFRSKCTCLEMTVLRLNHGHGAPRRSLPIFLKKNKKEKKILCTFSSFKKRRTL